MTALTTEDRIERAVDKALPHLRHHRAGAALRILARAARDIEAANIEGLRVKS